MKSCVLFCITAVVANTFIPEPIVPLKDVKESESRIISGQLAKPGQFPHQVLTLSNLPMKLSNVSFCGGALLCDRWVLTAAHCVKGADFFNLYLGSINQTAIDEPGRVVVVTETAFIHKKYDPVTLNFDVALIKFNKPVDFTDRIQPIPLGKRRVGANVRLTVSGWGKTANVGLESDLLNYVDVRTISNAECEGVYGSSRVIKSTICCKGFPEHNTCEGDSGGALIRKNAKGKFEHVGVVSFVHGYGCDIGKPSGFVRTNGVRSWILKTINGTCTLP